MGAAVGYGTQVYNNSQNGSANPWTSNINAEPIVNGAFIGAGVVLAAGFISLAIPVAVAGLGRAACADGDCTNEAIAAKEVISKQTTGIVSSTSNKSIVPYLPPNNGAAGEEVLQFAQKGQLLSRIGGDGGNYFSNPGTPRMMLSLPFKSQVLNLPERTFEVLKPFPYMASKIAPWYHRIGGGTQYRTFQTLKSLLEKEYLSKK